MTTVIPIRPKRTSRGPRPVSLMSALEAEPPPPPPWDLSMVRLPRWFTPTLRDLMEVAERTFGRCTGATKRRWVCEAMLSALASDLGSEPSDFSPPEYSGDLINVLIEGVWGLHFRLRPKSELARAIEKMGRMSGRLALERDEGSREP